MLKVNNKNTRTTPLALASFWCLYCCLRTSFTPCSSVPAVNFEHVIVGLVYMNNLPDDVIYAGDSILNSKCDQASNLCQKLQLASEYSTDLQGTIN